MKANKITDLSNEIYNIIPNDYKNIDSFFNALLMYSEYNVKVTWSFFPNDSIFALYIKIITILDNSSIANAIRSKIIRICKTSKTNKKYNDRINSMIEFFEFMA